MQVTGDIREVVILIGKGKEPERYTDNKTGKVLTRAEALALEMLFDNVLLINIVPPKVF